MRRLKKNVATAMIAAMSLTMLPAQLWGTTVDAATTKKVAAKKIEITVSNNKGLKSALKKSNVNKIILNTASAKNFRVPKGNYKDKILVINSSDKSKVYISKGAKFKKIIYLGTVKNASLVIDEAGNKIEIASKTTLNISGKAAYADIVYKAGAEEAKVSSKIELIVQNKAKKTVKLTIAGKKVSVKSGDSYANSDLDVTEDDTAQGAAVIKEEDSNQANTGTNENKSSSTDTVNSGSTGSTGGGYIGGGYSGGGSTSGNSSTPVAPDKETDKLVNSDRTKLVQATSFLRYVVVNLVNNYKLDDVTVAVDGVDVTSELTPVDKEGTIYKWEVSSLNPGEVNVVSKKDSNVAQIVKLNRDINAGEIVKPVPGNNKSLPKYLIGYGTIPVWEYHATNFDEQGKKRVSAASTTFSINLKDTKRIGERIYYTEPATLGGKAEIQFNYTSADDKEWFDSITGVDLLDDDDNNRMRVENLPYETEKREHHGTTVGVIKLQTGGVNFSIAGYYRLRIKTGGNRKATTLARFKVEENVTPVIKFEEVSTQSGRNLHFGIDGVSARPGKSPIEKAELVLPTGETRTLRHISDYILLGRDFILYNDTTKGDVAKGTQGINNTYYNGNYTLKLYFREYKSAEITFPIDGGHAVEVDKNKKTTAGHNKVMAMGSKASMLTLDGMKFDAIAGASKTGTTQSGGGSVGGNTPMMNADLMVNVDLYANAKIFESLKIENAYAKGILDRLEGGGFTRFTAIFDKETGKSYKWSDFINTVVTARAAGKYLTVADYINTYNPEGKTRTKKPKEVLEDNLLGDLEYGSVMGAEAPKLEYKKELTEGEELVIKATPDYISKIKKLCPARTKNLSPYNYIIMDKNYIKDVDGGKLTINAEGVKFNGKYIPGTLKIYVVAEGYDTEVITVELKGGEKTPDQQKDPANPQNPGTPQNPDNGGQNETKQDETSKRGIPLLKSGENYSVQDTSGKIFTIGSGFIGIISTEVKKWLSKVNSVTFDGNNVAFKLNQWGYLEITRPDVKNKEVTMVIEATDYKTYTFTVIDNGSNVVITNGRETYPTVPSKPETVPQQDNGGKPDPNQGGTTTPDKTEEEKKKAEADKKAKEEKERLEQEKKKQEAEAAKKAEEAKKQAEEEAKKKQEEDSNLISLKMPKTFTVPVGVPTTLMIDKDFLGKGIEGVTKQWLGKVTKVYVNGTEYQKVEYSGVDSLKENQFAKEDSIIGNKLHIRRPQGVNNCTLEIVADGYKTYVFTFDNSKTAVDITKGEEKKAVTPSVPNNAEEEAKKQKEAEEAAKQKAAEEEAAKQKAAEEEAAKQKAAEEEAAKQKAAEEEARKKQAEEEARKKQAEEEARKKQAEEEARKKQAEEEARKKQAEEEVRKKQAEEEARKKQAEEEARKKQLEEENAKYPITKIEWDGAEHCWKLHIKSDLAAKTSGKRLYITKVGSQTLANVTREGNIIKILNTNANSKLLKDNGDTKVIINFGKGVKETLTLRRKGTELSIVR